MPDTAPTSPHTEHHIAQARTYLDAMGAPSGAGECLLSIDDIAEIVARAEIDTLRLAPGSNNPPQPIDLEKLVDPDALPEAFVAAYPKLVTRSAELIAATERWTQGHAEPPPADHPDGKPWPLRLKITDETDNQKTSDFLRMIGAFAGGASPASGAVNEQREKVKKPLLDAGKTVDAWFNSLRDPLRVFTTTAGSVQTAYLRDKAAAEQRRRDEEARQAAEAAEAARQAAIAAQGDDAAVTEAIRTAEAADRAEQKAEAPRTEMARSTSVYGTTTSLRSNWSFRVMSLIDLVKAVAEGKAPIDFLTTQDGVIRASIKAGRRDCAGLEIYNEEKAVRSGRTT